MKTKRKLGMGVKGRKSILFRRGVVKKITRSLKKSLNASQLNDTKSAVTKIIVGGFATATRTAIKKAGGQKNIRIPSIISFEAKTGGILPLIPLFAGLSALGSLAGGASAIAKTIRDAKKKLGKIDVIIK